MPQPLPVLVLLSLDLQTSVRRWLCVAGDDDGDCDDEDLGGCSGCDDGGGNGGGIGGDGDIFLIQNAT